MAKCTPKTNFCSNRNAFNQNIKTPFDADGCWLLSGGIWNDDCFWNDSEFWED